MMPFLLLATANAAMIIYILRKRGVATIEGVCMLYLAVAVLSDHLALLWKAMFLPEEMRFGYGEFNLRLFPTLVHILGLAALYAGLYFTDPVVPTSAGLVTVPARGHDGLILSGLIIATIGAALFAIAVMLVGAPFGPQFYETIDTYRSGTPHAYGAFWFRGVDFMILGLAFVFVGMPSNFVGRVLLFLLMAAIPFFATGNKGGVERACLCIIVTSASFNRALFASLTQAYVVAAAMPILIWTLGLKLALLGGAGLTGWTVSRAMEHGQTALVSRFSDEGLYRGYCSFIDYFRVNPEYHSQFNVGLYTFQSWVPRMVYESKAPHPFLALGRIINPDGHFIEGEACAPTLVGYAYADYGMTSTITYLAVGGATLGLMRRYMAGPRAPLIARLAYVCYALLGGLSSEVGFLGAFYVLGLLIPVMALTQLILFLFYDNPRVATPARRRPVFRAPEHLTASTGETGFYGRPTGPGETPPTATHDTR
jgi:hypothetical protein